MCSIQGTLLEYYHYFELGIYCEMNSVFKKVFFYLISYHWSLSSPLENIKNRGFLMLSGGIERDQWHKMG